VATAKEHRLKPSSAFAHVVCGSQRLALVTTAAEAQDRIREAQRAIRQYGALVPDRYGALKQNPACFLERDARAGMLSALRALNLDLEPLRDRGRSTVFDRK
jgi:hypothetical protein